MIELVVPEMVVAAGAEEIIAVGSSDHLDIELTDFAALLAGRVNENVEKEGNRRTYLREDLFDDLRGGDLAGTVEELLGEDSGVLRTERIQRHPGEIVEKLGQTMEVQEAAQPGAPGQHLAGRLRCEARPSQDLGNHPRFFFVVVEDPSKEDAELVYQQDRTGRSSWG